MQRWLFERLIAGNKAVMLFTFEEELSRRYGGNLMGRYGCVAWAPDFGQELPLVPREQARLKLGLPGQLRLVLSAGVLSKRKSIDLLIGALAHPKCKNDIGALLLGRTDDFTEEILRGDLASMLQAKNRLWRWNSEYDSSLYSLALSAADCAWCVYDQHFTSSGFLWEAARAGLPTLGTSVGVIGEEIGKCGLGIAIKEPEPSLLSQALDRLTRPGEERKRWSMNCLQAGELHTSRGFARAICDGLLRIAESASQKIEG